MVTVTTVIRIFNEATPKPQPYTENPPPNAETGRMRANVVYTIGGG